MNQVRTHGETGGTPSKIINAKLKDNYQSATKRPKKVDYLTMGKQQNIANTVVVSPKNLKSPSDSMHFNS